VQLVLLGAAGLVALYAVFSPGKTVTGTLPGASRTYTKADLPKLRELMLSKLYLGRELRLCLQKQTEHSLFNTQQAIAFGIGLFTGVIAGDPSKGLAAARATTAAFDAAGSKAPACGKEIELTKQQIASHDLLTKQLGLPADVTYEKIQLIVAQLGGLEQYDPNDLNSDLANWDRCVKAHGIAVCKQASIDEHEAIPEYDPKTGISIKPGETPPSPFVPTAVTVKPK
jgi:hypothetical protein